MMSAVVEDEDILTIPLEDDRDIALAPSTGGMRLRSSVAPASASPSQTTGQEQQEFLQHVHRVAMEVYPEHGLRVTEDMYFHMIPGRVSATDIFWIDMNHPFWLAISGTYGDGACVLRMPIPGAELLAVRKEIMDEIIGVLWQSLCENKMTRHRLSVL